MKFVPQLHWNDCGVACVAMVAGTTWVRSVLAIFPNAVELWRFGTKTRDLTNGLRKLGVQVEGRLVSAKSWSQVPKRSVVKIVVAGQRDWHWVVWDGKKVLCPTLGPLDPASLPSSWILRSYLR